MPAGTWGTFSTMRTASRAGIRIGPGQPGD
ncbi:hypothetical protein FDG2_6179 [Candidatus Protofrankia californiensis]|uniref:Uncharacterized protein n=1 Tax=Candidatus Protofrankia californiensis TaxID=1839754 RepID=A0A1C3PGD4_9ACTN|nr:hypothetical protein FDG2_6179 [Candidatus Protofrankia californiensis]